MDMRMQEGGIRVYVYCTCNEIENAVVEAQPIVASLIFLFLSKLNASPSPWKGPLVITRRARTLTVTFIYLTQPGPPLQVYYI